jgi:hypothetical protein
MDDWKTIENWKQWNWKILRHIALKIEYFWCMPTKQQLRHIFEYHSFVSFCELALANLRSSHTRAYIYCITDLSLVWEQALDKQTHIREADA